MTLTICVVFLVGLALGLWTLERGLGTEWTPDLAAAWTAAYTVLSDFRSKKPMDSARRRDRPPRATSMASAPPAD
jgi:hypothetical protein